MLILILLIYFILVLCILFIVITILVCEFSLLIKIPLVLVLLSFVSIITFEALSILRCEWREIRDYMKAVHTLKHQIDANGFEKEDFDTPHGFSRWILGSTITACKQVLHDVPERIGSDVSRPTVSDNLHQQ